MEIAHASVLQRYNHLVDEIKDPASWAREMFANDATFVLGNFPMSTGHDQIAAAAQGVYNLAEPAPPRHKAAFCEPQCVCERGHCDVHHGRRTDPQTHPSRERLRAPPWDERNSKLPGLSRRQPAFHCCRDGRDGRGGWCADIRAAQVVT